MVSLRCLLEEPRKMFSCSSDVSVAEPTPVSDRLVTCEWFYPWSGVAWLFDNAFDNHFLKYFIYLSERQ